MTLFEQIQKACGHGLYPIVELGNGKKYIVSPHKDHDGDYRESYTDSTTSLGVDTGVPEEGWGEREKDGCKITGYHPQPYKPYEVGDKVCLLEHVTNRDVCDDLLTAGVCYINDVFNGSSGLHYDIRSKSGTTNHTGISSVRHEWLSPYFPEEKPVEEVEEEPSEIDALKEKVDKLTTRVSELEECGVDFS